MASKTVVSLMIMFNHPSKLNQYTDTAGSDVEGGQLSYVHVEPLVPLAVMAMDGVRR